MATYFHLCKAKLGLGSVIEPGNYGELIRIGGYRHTSFQREMVLEEARKKVAPQAPSRLDCLFAFPSEIDARAFQFREFSGFGSDYLYEITPARDGTPVFSTQISILENWPQDYINKARLYWDQTQSPMDSAIVTPPGMGMGAGFQEVLLGGSVVVIRQLGRMISQ